MESTLKHTHQPRLSFTTMLFVVTALAVSIVASSAVLATQASANSGTAEEQEACTPDVFRLCSADIPSETRIVACLNRKKAQLSVACHAVITKPDGKKNSNAKR